MQISDALAICIFICLIPIYSSLQFLHFTMADHGDANMYSSV